MLFRSAERAGCSAGRGEAQDGPLGLSAGQAGVEWGRAGAGQIGLARGWVPGGKEREWATIPGLGRERRPMRGEGKRAG